MQTNGNVHIAPTPVRELHSGDLYRCVCSQSVLCRSMWRAHDQSTLRVVGSTNSGQVSAVRSMWKRLYLFTFYVWVTVDTTGLVFLLYCSFYKLHINLCHLYIRARDIYADIIGIHRSNGFSWYVENAMMMYTSFLDSQSKVRSLWLPKGTCICIMPMR